MSTAASTSTPGKRVAIITGAAEGIGHGIALRLAKDGFDLGLFDLPRAQEKLERLAETVRGDFGVRVVNVYGDVSREEDVERLVETVVRELGSVWAVSAAIRADVGNAYFGADGGECGYLDESCSA